MDDLRFLVVDDAENFRKAISRLLKRMAENVICDVAADYDQACSLIRRHSYDIAVLDMALLGTPVDAKSVDKQGFDLIGEIRGTENNRHCGIIILTAYGSVKTYREAVRRRGAYDLLDKAEFDDGVEFLKTVREALFDARYSKARNRSHIVLSIFCNQNGIWRSQLQGPGDHFDYTLNEPLDCDFDELSKLADDLNKKIHLPDRSEWRTLARDIGISLYSRLNSESDLRLTSSQDLAHNPRDLWICLHTPTVGIGVPFELLRNRADQALVLEHGVTRRLDGLLNRNTQPFRDILMGLWREPDRSVRVLLVASNSDGSIPHVDQEVGRLKNEIEADLGLLGIHADITMLDSAHATYRNVQRELQSSSYDIFHYAGHGRFDDKRPEVSGLVLKDGIQPKTLEAQALKLMVNHQSSRLRMVFLSCCLGARSAESTRHGDFHGMFDALARANVPMVLGYRWAIDDSQAIEVASAFYSHLWRTFMPGDALLEARRTAAIKFGRDESIWAAPVLLMQNEP